MEFTLYQIAEEMLPILSSEEWTEEQEQAIERLEMDLERKADNIISYTAKLESFADMCRAEEKRIADKRKAAENRVASLKEYLLRTMKGIDRTEIQCGTKTIKIQKNPPSVVVDDEEKIPARFFVIIPETKQLDKAALKSALKSGSMECAHLEQGERLVVK